MLPARAQPRPLARLRKGAKPLPSGGGSGVVNSFGSVVQLIDLRSFSSLWYWIAVAVFWSRVTHSTLGVPYDMVLRARRRGGQDLADLQAMVALQLRRRAAILHQGGTLIALLWAMALSALGVLGFGYGLELAQAVTLLMLPATLVAGLRLRLMQRLAGRVPDGEALCKALTWHRLGVQTIALAAILVTTLWGMWFNLNVRTLGG